MAPGGYNTAWDGRDDAGRRLSSGVYLYRFTTDEREVTRRTILLRD